MERIAILGCGGSGKSHLARQLAGRLGLPLTHLDAIYYDDDWHRLPEDKFIEIQRQLAAGPAWIIEGNYASTLPLRLEAADTVIVLDLPAHVCLRGVLERHWQHGAGQHQELGVYARINWGFIRYILGYRRFMLPRVHQLIAEHAPQAELVVLRNRRAARCFVEALPASTA